MDAGLLYAYNYVETNLAWYLHEEILNSSQAKTIKKISQDLTAKLGKQSLKLIQAFGIPDHVICAPIAGDWVKYNEVDNQGEIIQKSRL